jgi:hypothetical protein
MQLEIKTRVERWEDSDPPMGTMTETATSSETSQRCKKAKTDSGEALVCGSEDLARRLLPEQTFGRLLEIADATHKENKPGIQHEQKA